MIRCIIQNARESFSVELLFFSGSSWWMAICATSVRCTLFLVFLPVQYEYQFALLGSRSKDWNSLLIDSIHPSCSYDNQPTSLAPFIFINFFGSPRFPRYSDATSCSTQKGVNVSLFDVIISKGTRRWLSSRLWRFYKWMRPLWREMRNNLTCLMVSKRIFFWCSSSLFVLILSHSQPFSSLL